MVENKKRGRGRPRCFNEGEALDRAIKIFWSKGFSATTLDDLSAGTGLGRPSLYCAFGDKEGIFMRSLERYALTVAAAPLAALSEEKIQNAIAGYLFKTAEYATEDNDHLGCMLGCVACAVEERSVREYVAEVVDYAKTQIAQRLQAAVETGELPSDFPVERRAQRAINAMIALTMRARHGIPLPELLEDAKDGTQAVLH